MSDKKMYLYSTLSNDQVYTNWSANPTGDVATPISEIFVAGKANIMTKNFITPLGVVTPVTEEELAELQRNEVFQTHVKNGFIQISDKKVDPEIAVATMEGRDQSAPLVSQDLSEDQQPKTNSPKRS